MSRAVRRLLDTEMQLRIGDMLADRAAPADAVARLLHGSEGAAVAARAMAAVEHGLWSRDVGPRDLANRRSLAQWVIIHDNIAALRALVQAGPPAGHELAISPGQAWLDHLCCFTTANTCVKASLYTLAASTIGAGSADALALAHEMSPDDRDLRGPKQSSYPPFAALGGLHYRLLWATLSGLGSNLNDAVLRATTLNPEPLVRDRSMEELRLRYGSSCLTFLRSIGAPCGRYDGEPLDATPFVLAFGAGAEKQNVAPLMKIYASEGLVDFTKHVPEHLPQVGGSMPLEIAVWAGNSGAAVALFELGYVDAADVHALGTPSDQRSLQALAALHEAVMTAEISAVRAGAACAEEPPRARRARIGGL